MKKNAGRLSKKVFAAMMAGTLMTAMVGVNVSAQSEELVTPITSVSVKKTVTTDGKTYAPDTTFNFSVSAASATTGEKNGNDVVYDGVQGGLVASNGAQFTPNKDDTLSSTYEANGALTVNPNVFTRPGVFKYTVEEDETDQYEGVTYDTTVYTVYLYVYNDIKDVDEDESTEDFYVGDVIVKKGSGKADLTFENDYGKTNQQLHKLDITKVVTGTQADMAREFEFDVTITGQDSTKEVYHIDTTNNDSYTLASGETTTIRLSNNEKATIYGLSQSDTYVVEEKNYSVDGYTAEVTSKTNGAANATVDGAKVSGTIAADGAIVVTNTKNASTPTGIAMTYGPYALMVALAGGMAVLFFRRRNREDY